MRWLGIGGSEMPTANITQNMQVGRFTNLISSFSVRGDSNDMQTGPFMVMFLAVNDYHSVFPAIREARCIEDFPPQKRAKLTRCRDA